MNKIKKAFIEIPQKPGNLYRIPFVLFSIAFIFIVFFLVRVFFLAPMQGLAYIADKIIEIKNKR